MKLKTNCLFYHHDGMCLYTGKDFDCENCEFYALSPVMVKQKIEGLKKEIIEGKEKYRRPHDELHPVLAVPDYDAGYIKGCEDTFYECIKLVEKWFEDAIE